jgi:hypothetical protein
MSRLPPPCLLFAAFLALVPATAFAGPSSEGRAVAIALLAQDDETDKAPAAPAKNAGSIDGQVVAVDYKVGHITVKAATTQYDVVVLPSTEFRGHNNNFHTIADIQKGAHVHVMMSQRAGTYTAQIIRLY